MSRNIFRFVSLLALVLLVATTFLAYRSLRGVRLESITSGSMAPSLSTGSLILVRTLPPWQYKVGDIVTFKAPLPGFPLVTHRITRLYRLNSGLPVMETKGDANAIADPWVVSVGDIVGKERLAVPRLGTLLVWLQTPFGFLGCAIASLLLIVLPEVLSLRSLRPTSIS